MWRRWWCTTHREHLDDSLHVKHGRRTSSPRLSLRSIRGIRCCCHCTVQPPLAPVGHTIHPATIVAGVASRSAVGATAWDGGSGRWDGPTVTKVDVRTLRLACIITGCAAALPAAVTCAT